MELIALHCSSQDTKNVLNWLRGGYSTAHIPPGTRDTIDLFAIFDRLGQIYQKRPTSKEFLTVSTFVFSFNLFCFNSDSSKIQRIKLHVKGKFKEILELENAKEKRAKKIYM